MIFNSKAEITNLSNSIFQHGLSNIFSYLRLKAKSVLASSIVHSAYNATPPLIYMFHVAGNDLIVGVCGITVFSVLLILNILIYYFDKNLNPLILDC